MQISLRSYIGVQKDLMAKYFPGFTFHDVFEDPYFHGSLTTGDGSKFEVRIELGSGYPDEYPRSYIWHPLRLPMYDGSHLNDIEFSHAYHVRDNSPDGRVQVCHVEPSKWGPEMTIMGVTLTTRIWLECYRIHRRTGETIDDLLKLERIKSEIQHVRW